MEELLMFMLFFLLVYLMYFVFVIARKKKLAKFKESTEVKYLESKYHLNFKGVSTKELAHILAITNALIISLTALITGLVASLILKIIVGFIILLGLILIGYEILGRYYKKKINRVNKGGN